MLIDTGPLVALLNRDDSRHEECRRQAEVIGGPVLTTWAVVTEAAWLLRVFTDGLERLLQTLQDQDIQLVHVEHAALDWIIAHEKRYRNLKPQVADLSLLYLAQMIQTDRIFTLDRRDFAVYRTVAGKPFQLLP